MKIQYAALSETGLEKQENQDCLFCGADGTTGLFVVADGMGGHQDGARASGTIVEKVSVWWAQYLDTSPRPDFWKVLEELKALFSQTNQEIYDYTEKGEICGSTLVALWLEESAWGILSCGDSRCYQTRGRILKKQLIQLTTDDVWENQSRNVEGMTRQQIEASTNYGCLVKAVGVKPQFQCSIQTDRYQETTLFVLCSDGIYKYCSHDFLKKQSFLALRSGEPETAAHAIRDQVFQNGAGDNLSLVLVLAERKQSSNRSGII